MATSVGCTITTVNTNLSCDIDICDHITEGKTIRMSWSRMGGRLDLGKPDGRWFNFKPNSEHKGIVLFPHKENEGAASAYSNADILATLLGVPENFVQRLDCAESFSGEGLLHKTNETVRWKIWFPCA